MIRNNCLENHHGINRRSKYLALFTGHPDISYSYVSPKDVAYLVFEALNSEWSVRILEIKKENYIANTLNNTYHDKVKDLINIIEKNAGSSEK